MKYFLIIVEGAHDIATIERILRMHGIDRPVRQKSELPAVWKRMIPEKYPFRGDDLDRITPVPSFWANDEISVAIKCAGSDAALISCLKEACSILKLGEKMQLQRIMLICDADKKTAEDKKKSLLNTKEFEDDFQLYGNKDHWIVKLDEIEAGKRIEIPLEFYAFPDDENSGTLEDLLLEAAQEVYPQLKKDAEVYINSVDKSLFSKMQDEVKRQKATVGCIANVLKPGKANQVAVADGEWISTKSVKCTKVAKLYEAIEAFIK